MPRSVDALNMEAVKKSIRWRGMVRLHQLREDDESLLGIARWPKKTGPEYYACATSGLLFDMDTGHCVQSHAVVLLIETISPAAPKEFDAYINSRRRKDYGYLSRDTLIGGDDAC